MENEQKEQPNPFEGLPRMRLPGMHLITAVESGMPLREALAAHFFTMLHDKVEHNCLMKKAKEEHDKKVREAVEKSSNPDSAGMNTIFGLMGSTALAQEEWSYISHEDAFTFYLIAGTAIEQTQRWICQGVEKPYPIPLGPLVARPDWALKRDWEVHEKGVQYITDMRKEIEEAKKKEPA